MEDKKYKTYKRIILLILIIGIAFVIFKIVFPPTVKFTTSTDKNYLFQIKNAKAFEASFGEEQGKPSIVFQKGGSVLMIELPYKNATWKQAGDGIQVDLKDLSYRYSLLKNEKDKPIGLKEEIILNKPININSFIFPINLKNLHPQNIDGVWHFFDNNQKEQFYIPKSFMIDANQEKSENIEMEINAKAGYIIVTPDKKWLSDPSRKYPIIIDPTIETVDSNSINSIPQNQDAGLNGPILTNAYVSPNDVRVGDKMLVSVDVEDSSGISKIEADMGGIETIALKLAQGTIYKGTWQATWLVHDTGPMEYTTIITATNIQAQSSSTLIKWTDAAELKHTVTPAGQGG
jgi:hypothetical protein